jgi:hypothetical protein
MLMMVMNEAMLLLFDPGPSQTASLSNTHLTTFAGNVLCSWCLHSQVILDQPKEARSFPQW